MAGLDISVDVVEQTELSARDRNVVAKILPSENSLRSNVEVRALVAAVFLAVTLVALLLQLGIQFLEFLVLLNEEGDGTSTSTPLDELSEEGVGEKESDDEGDHDTIVHPEV